MFDSQRKSIGRDYTATVSLFAPAFIFGPALLIVSKLMGSLSISLAIVCSATCAALAFFNWKRTSELFIPSIANPSTESK